MNRKHWRFVCFLLAGGLNTLFGYLCYATAIGVLRLPLPWAILASQIAGTLFNYQSYGRLVFRAGSAAPRRIRLAMFGRFLLVSLTIYGLNLGLLTLLARNKISPYLAQLLALIIVVPTSYGLLRSCVWRNHVLETENVNQEKELG